jgi:cysteine synthase
VLIAGLGDDALQVAQALGRGLARAHVCDGGSVVGHTRRRVEDRRGALAARAYGVQSGQTILVAYGLGNGNPADPRIAALPGIGADQVWVVVDVSRRTVDTARWVNAVRAVTDVAAMATLAGRFTGDREAVSEIGLPEGWSDRVG